MINILHDCNPANPRCNFFKDLQPFHLRNIEPPYDLVKPEIDQVVKETSLELLNRDDPEAVDEMREEMAYDIADLKARMRRSN